MSKKTETTIEDVYKHPFKYCPSGFGVHMTGTKCGDAKVLDVRGWGYLTGGGALNLDEDEAEKIQDEFGVLVAKLLNDHFNKQK